MFLEDDTLKSLQHKVRSFKCVWTAVWQKIWIKTWPLSETKLTSKDGLDNGHCFRITSAWKEKIIITTLKSKEDCTIGTKNLITQIWHLKRITPFSSAYCLRDLVVLFLLLYNNSLLGPSGRPPVSFLKGRWSYFTLILGIRGPLLFSWSRKGHPFSTFFQFHYWDAWNVQFFSGALGAPHHIWEHLDATNKAFERLFTATREAHFAKIFFRYARTNGRTPLRYWENQVQNPCWSWAISAAPGSSPYKNPGSTPGQSTLTRGSLP